MKQFLSAFLLACFATCSHGADYALIIGGGASPDSSEVSIEKNAEWISGLLQSRYSIKPLVIFAGGTMDDTPDVKFKLPPNTVSPDHMAVARVFGIRNRLSHGYRKNKVATEPEPANRENTISLISESLSSMSSGDNLLVVYSGHGGNAKAKNDHHLRLWNRSELTVADMAAVLEKQPGGTTVRLILPQCFSGPFVRLIHQSLDDEPEGINARRCAFVAAPAHRESEGCTPEVDEQDYVDYATHFFGALQGQSRVGQPLKENPDAGGNGITEFLEAHYYTSLHGFTKDVPRTTSEYFLESWLPWYFRWQSFLHPQISPNNPFAKMSLTIARQLGLPNTTNRRELSSKLSAGRRKLEAEIRSLQDRLEDIRESEDLVQSNLGGLLDSKWPELEIQQTQSLEKLPLQTAAQIAGWLRGQKKFLTLLQLQREIDGLEEKSLTLDRQLGMHMRGLRYLELTRLYELLYRFGSPEDMAQYESLQECEAWSPELASPIKPM